MVRKMTSFSPEYLDLVLHFLDSPKASKQWRKNAQALVFNDKGYGFFQVRAFYFCLDMK